MSNRWFRVCAASMGLVMLGGMADADEPASMLDRLAEAIRYPTISHQDPALMDREAFAGFGRFLRARYPRAFAELDVETVSEFSLLMRWPGQRDDLRPVLFDAHYDVVPIEPGTLQDWTHPPFDGVVEGGFVWGRGSLDDKIAVVATFEAIEQLLTAGFSPQRTLLFAIGHDEEVRGLSGAAQIAALLARRGVELEYVVGEGGGVVESNPLLPGRTVAMIALAEKGYLTLRLTAEGEGGHSSTPPTDSALIRLARAVTALHERPFEAELVSPVTDMLEAIGSHSEGANGLLLRNLWLTRPLLISRMGGDRMSRAMVHTTTAVTMLDAGVKENVVPQRAEARVNFRLLPGVTADQVIERVERIIDDPRIEIDADYWGRSPAVADIEGEGYRRLSAGILAVLPEAIVIPGLLVATTDSRHYVDLTRDVYRFHPMAMDLAEPVGIHGTDERIPTQGVLQAPALYRELIQRAAEP